MGSRSRRFRFVRSQQGALERLGRQRPSMALPLASSLSSQPAALSVTPSPAPPCSFTQRQMSSATITTISRMVRSLTRREYGRAPLFHSGIPLRWNRSSSDSWHLEAGDPQLTSPARDFCFVSPARRFRRLAPGAEPGLTGQPAFLYAWCVTRHLVSSPGSAGAPPIACP